MDNELFELCKEVYERTAWDSNLERYYVQSGIQAEVMYQAEILPPDMAICPLYTSDYLLEKLPHRIDSDDKRSTTGTRLVIEDQTRVKSESLGGGLDVTYSARYETTYGVTRIDGNLMNCHADTPLKALLKLIIALDDAGVKI